VIGWLLLVAAGILFLVLWVRATIDVFGRHDLSGSAKAAWAIIMLIVPFLALFAYTLLRPSDAQIARRAAR
jgi:Phospholipase_D-nuclease N-terminal